MSKASMSYGEQRIGTVANRILLIEERLTKKYRRAEASARHSPPANGSAAAIGAGPSPGGDGTASPIGGVATGQSLPLMRTFACDDGAPIHLQYNGGSFREPAGKPAGGQSHSASLSAQALPHHFEAFADESSPAASCAPRADHTPPAPNKNKTAESAQGSPARQGQSPEAQADNASRAAAPEPAGPPVSQQSLPPTNEDTFVADLQALLSEARRRADTGQETPALSPASAGQAVAPPAPPQPPAPTAASPAAQEQMAGTDTTNRHALFDQLGQQMQRPVTFDIGTVQVDKTFAALEASMNAQAAQREAAQRSRAKLTSPPAKPLQHIETVEDMALMTAPPDNSCPPATGTLGHKTTASSVEAYMMSSDIPLDPGTGGRSIPVSTLEIGDLIVSTTKDTPSQLIRFGTKQPVSHAMLYVGSGQVVEAVAKGVVLRSVEEALADSYLAVAFRHPILLPEQALLVRDYAGQQLGKPYNYEGIVKQAGFQLDRGVHCSDKRGDEYDRCVRWYGQVNLGTATNDRFFCSELVLKSYEAAGIPLTTTPPNYNTPGDIAELRQNGMLAYVGHLKFEP